MAEELPRHERILKRINDLTDKAINGIKLNCEGGLTLLEGGGRNIVSGGGSGRDKDVVLPPSYTLHRQPLNKIGEEDFTVTVGTEVKVTLLFAAILEQPTKDVYITE